MASWDKIDYDKAKNCNACGNKLTASDTRRECDKNGNSTGKYVCRLCYDNMKTYKTTDKDKIKEIRNKYFEKKKKYYNRTNTCDRCGKNLEETNPRKEYDNDDKWTGKWICDGCRAKEYRLTPGSPYQLIKEMRDFRLGNLDPNCETGKGHIFVQITCKARKVKSLDIENDNFDSPIDHSSDIELGILQTKGRIYNPDYNFWSIPIDNEHNKEFDNLIFYCMDEYRINIVRVYIFPKEEVVKEKRSNITIYNNDTKHWYDKYRVDEKPYNDAYRSLDENDLKVIRKKRRNNVKE